MDTDGNLLFGVLALQVDLLTPAQFAEACSAWAGRKGTPLAVLLVERGWLSPADRIDVEKLLQRKLAKHGGDARASLAEVTSDAVRQSLAGLDDADVRESLVGITPPPQGHALLSTSAYVPGAGERYTLSRLHATGGIGRVWLARDASLGRDVALKELRPERAGQPALWARFLREAQVTGQLEHPGIVPVYEVGCRPDDEAPFYTMRFVRGRTLADATRAYHERRARRAAGPLELRELLMAFVGVCQAVAYAHGRGVLHRDLKPQNIVLGDYGEVIVLDWGLAKVLGHAESDAAADRAPVALQGEGARDETVAGQVLGTPAYMAPEQAEGRLDLLDTRTDVYGLGAVLYEVLTGQPPFAAGDTTAVLRRVVHDAPQPPRTVVPGVPRALEAVCLKALAKRPAERYARAQELAEDVKRFLADEPVDAYRDPLTTRLTRWGRRHRTLAAGAGMAVLAVLAGLGAVLAVQAQANQVLAGKNAELAKQKRALAENNTELAEQQAAMEARFELAQKAIATFHTGVSEDALLKNREFTELRTKLLKEAAGFYGELELLLAGKTDAKSRRLLAAGYFQLGVLTEKIGGKTEALAVHQKSLALRRELAAAPGADVEMRLDVARSLGAVAGLLRATGDQEGALAAFEEERDLAAALAAESPTDAVRQQLASGHHGVGMLRSEMSKPAEALQADEQARAIWQQLADANPAVTEFQSALAQSNNNIGLLMSRTGNPAEALKAWERAQSILQHLADANPAVTQFQNDLARSHNNMGFLLWQTGKPAEALKAFEKTRAISQKLADAHLAVTDFQRTLALSHNNIGAMLILLGKPAEALEACEQARAIHQKLADGNPAVTHFQFDLALSHHNIGLLLAQTGKLAEALEAHDQQRAIMQKLAATNPTSEDYQSQLAESHYRVGGLLARQGRFAKAFASLNQGQSLCQRLADAHPEIPSHLLHLGYSHAFRGKAHIRAGHPAEAAPDLRCALKLWAQNKTADSDDLFERARALALLAGLGADAKSGVTADEAKVLADQAIAALRDAVQAGWSWPAELKEPDFDALRGRDDFRKLVAQVEAKAGPRAKLKD
jgi:serine/threonine-protein kinase